MVSSLDGMIGKKDNSVSWFETNDHFEKGIELTEEQTKEFLKTIDCYIMGSATYEHALELSKSYGWAYGEVPTIVLSHRKLPVDKKNIEIYSGDLYKLVREQLRPRFKNVWLVGGPTIAKEFIRLKLVDEIRLSILPIILGDGLPFFNQIEQEHLLHLKETRTYKSGMVELCYEIKK